MSSVPTAIPDPTSPGSRTRSRFRRFRLIRGGVDGHDHVVAELPPKLVQLSPGSARWHPGLSEALGPSYRVVTTTVDTPAAVVIDQPHDQLLRLLPGPRRTTPLLLL